MLYFQDNINHPRAETLTTLVRILRRGKVVVLPTDTIYGFSCLATKPAAIKAIINLKKRPSQRPFIVLVSGLAMLKKYAVVSRGQAALLKKIWSKKRPTTVILENRGCLPLAVGGAGGGLASRLPKNGFLIKIIKTVNQPLISTSVNISGRKPLIDARQILKFFSEGNYGSHSKNYLPAAILDAGRSRSARPSRLIDIRQLDKIVILRP